jgi:hypothetical protein
MRNNACTNKKLVISRAVRPVCGASLLGPNSVSGVKKPDRSRTEVTSEKCKKLLAIQRPLSGKTCR